jgi:4-diphosphocytidyl-2-C-methyl-D-erythritol kinase
VSAPALLRALAPAKINLGLFLGPVRERDGRHELVTVMQSISLADELTLGPAQPGARPAGPSEDRLECEGVPGPPEQNLAWLALREFRAETGWDAPAQLLRIEKRIPLAAGLAGGSADAAAALRLARAASGLGDEQLLLRIAARLGADVPAQVSPGRWLASGAGERLSPLPAPRLPFGVLVLPSSGELSTGAVYAEADRLGVARRGRALAERQIELAGAFEHGAPLPVARELLHNDLQRPAVSLLGEIADALRAVRGAGADPALVSGSGPTVVGLFAAGGGVPGEGLALARLAATTLGERDPEPVCAVPVEAAFAAPTLVGDGAVRNNLRFSG